MNPADFVRDYGYYAIVVGTFFEGELIMLAAGIAACGGMLTLPGVIAAGMIGIFASDTFCFLLGRWAGDGLRRLLPRLHARLDRVFHLIEKHDDKLIVYFQFFPGFCTVTPIAFGMSRISVARFMGLDLLGNALWTLVFSVGGYVFGSAFEHIVKGSHEWTALIAGLALVVGFSLWQGGRLLRKRSVPTA